MAIQLRRGLNADRITITPESGEPLWTTDTKKLYIGDGTTAGGNPVGGGTGDVVGPSSSVNNRVVFFDGTTGKLIRDSGLTLSPAALTKVNDTNVTLTLGGTPTTSLLAATSLTLGWTGQLSTSRGGTGLSTLGTSNQLIRVNSGATALEYFTPSYITTAVTSVGMTVPSAFSVTPSTITTSGTFAVTGAGSVSQYVRGDGTLATYNPGTGGGGASVSYYLNGSVTQGTFGGVAFKQMSKNAIFGTGTDFVISADGYIQSFITDIGDPNQLSIPGGNWNFEMYFSASSGGGTPSFYVELYKFDGTTLTSITTSSANPEYITNGTTIDLYITSLSVPSTTLTATDRLAIRVYVTHSGRTITLHTENSHLCQVITTFTTGLTALNGLTEQVQYFSTGTSGTDFAISSTGSTHTFNLPTASATRRGALSTSDWTTFNGKQNALSGTGFVKISGTTISYDNSTYLTGNQSITLSGDVSGTGPTAITTTIGANKVLNTMLAQIATATFKGRTSAGTGNVEDLTATQATALLNQFSTSTTTQGLVPGSNGVGSTYFLNAAGAWAVPAGSGGGGGTTTNPLIIKADSGTTEGTDLYTFDGSSAKTINIVAGTNITITKTAGTLTISSTGGSSDNPITLMTAFLNYT